MQEGGNPASDHQSKPGWYFSNDSALWDLHQNNQANITYLETLAPCSPSVVSFGHLIRSKYRHITILHHTLSTLWVSSSNDSIFVVKQFLQKAENHLCSPFGPWLMNRSPLSVTVEWEISKTCLFMIESSSSNCNCLLSRLCILSWPAAPCNGFQWCQRHDHRCRCRTSRSSRGVETMQKPWFQEGWIFRQNFDGENEIVIIDVTTTNQKTPTQT